MFKKNKAYLFAYIFILTISLSPFFLPKEAKANITLLPTRVLFEEGDRFKEVTLVNTGDKTKTYEMSWNFFRMQEQNPPYTTADGPITEVDPSKYISFTPRRVTLQPGAKQKVKLVLRRPKDPLPPGDYHIHLRFAGITPPPIAGQDIPEEKKTVVSINVGYTIPIVLRVGKSDVSAEIEPVTLKRNELNGRLNVMVPIKRIGGPYSVMGHLYVYHIGQDGKEERVGEISNAQVFPEVGHRLIEVPLIKKISGGSLRVILRNFDPNNNYILAEKIVPLQ